ncbi:unnamed protein product [Phytophthora fragariaefolia]|uniref:Unnamed protein product n=1 Tax=Phytophthora fragariaefolia TaxID=1490495 RepID=A0A9W6Y061_9STRA|nr:unnamed protein product [Phytophthora fragariaefolia]
MLYAGHSKLNNNDEVFDELLEGIDQVYADLDRQYDAETLGAVLRPGRKHQLFPDSPAGTPFVKFIDKNQVPFDLQHTEDAVWKFLQGPRALKGRVCSKVLLSCEGGLATYVREQRVARKFVEENRTVFVSRTLSEPTIVMPWPAGLRFSETMSVIVTAGKNLASGQESTIIERIVSVSRHIGGGKAVVFKEWSAFVDIAVEGWDRKMSCNRQEIENLLLDESIRTQNY